MNLKRHAQETPDVNLTPLIDVVFLLLIFFMVSTTFKKDQSIAIDLPESSLAPKTAPLTTSLEIIITAEGKYFVNIKEKATGNKPASSKRLQLVDTRLKYMKRAIRKITGGNNAMQVAIRADAKSPHQAFVRVMDALGQLGFKKVSIVTIPPK